MQAAIKSAFKMDQNAIKMFTNQEPSTFRTRLSQLQTDWRANRLAWKDYDTQSREIVSALSAMGSPLTRDELAILHRVQAIEFTEASSCIGESMEAGLRAVAADNIRTSEL
uniref:Uncharacterized protein n=2 Tax=Octactis speculum TaxID=3111310 RepID=A0A7S2BKW7_9STRA|mmetsp:Transcript_24351/g.33335  ORF Transcript_24351/g.33335 Transcript_24351/m.33335 type:complete len:111 (+) Transcript_24351:230-562(+)